MLDVFETQNVNALLEAEQFGINEIRGDVQEFSLADQVAALQGQVSDLEEL